MWVSDRDDRCPEDERGTRDSRPVPAPHAPRGDTRSGTPAPARVLLRARLRVAHPGSIPTRDTPSRTHAATRRTTVRQEQLAVGLGTHVLLLHDRGLRD